MTEFQRNVAYKVWVRDLVNSKYVRGSGGFESGYVPVKGVNVSRVNVIGIVVDKFANEDGSYVNVTLDDSSGYLRLRCWNEDVKILSFINVGDCVIVVGKVRDYNEEVYVVPEGIRCLDPKWMEYRKLELGSLSETSGVAKVEGEPRSILLDLIERCDTGDGAEYDSVVVKSGLSEAEAEEVIKDMVAQGEIFEVRAGYLKVML